MFCLSAKSHFYHLCKQSFLALEKGALYSELHKLTKLEQTKIITNNFTKKIYSLFQQEKKNKFLNKLFFKIKIINNSFLVK